MVLISNDHVYFRLEEPVLRPKRDTAQTFNCPKCSKTFAVLRLLQDPSGIFTLLPEKV